MIDNGAFGVETRGNKPNWQGFYKWARSWMDYHTTWAVIPDVIGGTEPENDRLLTEWYAVMGTYSQAAPVWHLHESLDRLERLVLGFERVCFGSSGQYWQVNSAAWNGRVNEAFNRICKGSGRPPAAIHMLRGMSLSGSVYPFASVDSADVARNHEQAPGRALRMARRWDAQQCPARWVEQPVQQLLQAVEGLNDREISRRMPLLQEADRGRP